jgi:hypothetical protein
MVEKAIQKQESGLSFDDFEPSDAVDVRLEELRGLGAEFVDVLNASAKEAALEAPPKDALQKAERQFGRAFKIYAGFLTGE